MRWADPKTQATNRAPGERDLTEVLVFRAPVEVKQKLEKAAAADHRTLSGLVMKLLREGLAKKQRNKTPK